MKYPANADMEAKSPITRRDLLKRCSAAAASLAAMPVASVAQPPAGATKQMHLSLAAYSMRESLTRGDMDLFKFIDWCAELEIPGTELTSYYFPEGFDTAYLQALKRRALANGLTISGTAVRNDFCMSSGEEKDENIAHVLKWIDYAADMFAPHIRIFAGTLPDGVPMETGVRWVADGIKAVLDHAGKRGVLIGLENHGGITARVADHLAICDAVGEHEWFGINLDTGNYRTNAYEELAQAAPRAVNVQVKVEVTRDDGSQEEADYERIRDILVDSGYRGWVALEYEGRDDPATTIPRHLEALKRLFA